MRPSPGSSTHPATKAGRSFGLSSTRTPPTPATPTQLPSKITATFNMNANDIDNRLLAGDLDVDAAGTGVQAAARAKILASPTLRATSDDPISGFL
jgi:peptide/nickel transport system substrate-binding protein